MDEHLERRKFMRRAVEMGKQSKSEAGNKPAVGVVVVRDGRVLGESFRGETGEGRHAEYGLLERLSEEGVDLSGSTVYTTLEPCSRRNDPKKPCATHLINHGVSAVYVGIYDPNPKIYREGWKMLRDAEISMKDFDEDFREQIAKDNSSFIDQYKIAIGQRGSASFDYSIGDGSFSVEHGNLKFRFRLTRCGHGSVYALDHTNYVADMRFAKEFNEIDNPGAYDWSHYSRKVAVGNIAAVRSQGGFLLLRVTDVRDRERGADRTEVAFDFEVRLERVIPTL